MKKPILRPTHEPIEQLAALRAMPNMIVFRPADSKETAAGWYYAIAKAKGSVSLILTRQTHNMRVLEK